MISASSLLRDCGYPRELSRIFPPSQALKDGAAKGTLFHDAVKRWAADRVLPETENEEVNGWLGVLAQSWWPTAGAYWEYALGLTVGGRHASVRETEAHVYVPLEDDVLLTAGRFDVFWLETYEQVPSIYVGPAEDPALPEGTPVVVVRDWKTGRWPVTPAGSNLQLAAGGFAAASLLEAKAMRLEVYYVRDGYCDSALIPLDSPEAAQLWRDLNEAARLDDEPRPGPHCGPCWERRKMRCQVGMREDL